MAIKLLIGGSPCTHWSIAQTKNREVHAEGIGWELFRNYLIAKEKFKPDFFLYENNKSASQEIKDQIASELGVGIDPDVRFTYINSALVSAQNRQRFYVTNFGDIEQPEDRGILLKDVIEGYTDREKGRAIISSAGRTTTREYFTKQQGNMVLEPILHQYPRGKNNGNLITGKSPTVTASYWEQNVKCFQPVNPLVSGKSRCITAGYANKGAKHILERNFSDNPAEQQWDSIAEPVNPSSDGKSRTIKAQYYKNGIANFVTNGGFGATAIGEPLGNEVGYAVPIEWENEEPIKAKSNTDGKVYPVYKVENGQITIKGKRYEIDLPDWYWIIRKLTVRECARLQTLPDDYCKVLSDTQAYKAIGNGWTAEVIIHLLNHALKDVPRDEEIIVLSLYDGIATGRYCLEKMGFTNITYHAYEIDPYPIQVAMDNYPDIIQHGDAFAVREDDWQPPKNRSEWLDDLLGG